MISPSKHFFWKMMNSSPTFRRALDRRGSLTVTIRRLQSHLAVKTRLKFGGYGSATLESGAHVHVDRPSILIVQVRFILECLRVPGGYDYVVQLVAGHVTRSRL